MGAKSDVITWAIILGAIGAAGYFGYQALKSAMGQGGLLGGLFSGTEVFGGEKVSTDIFGNVPAGTQVDIITDKVSQLEQQNSDVSAGLKGISNWPADLKAAYQAYAKEMQEYTEAAQEYQAGISWVESPFENIAGEAGAGSSSLWPWNWGKPSVQTQKDYSIVQSEYADAKAAYDVYMNLLTKYQAVNA